MDSKRQLIAALTGIAIGGIGFGLVSPVTVILLEKAHFSSFVNGLAIMTGNLSVMLFSIQGGRFVDRYGPKLVLLSGLFIWAIGALAHYYVYNMYILFPARIITGIGGVLIFVSTEVIINSVSTAANRGRYIGLYAGILSLGIAGGTFLIWTHTIHYYLPFGIASAVMFFVFIFQMYLLKNDVKSHEQKNPPKMKLTEMPAGGLAASFLYGIFEASIIVALPLFALRNNFNDEQLQFFLGSFVLGGIILLYLIGKISDLYARKKVLAAVTVLMIILFLLVPFSLNYLGLLIFFFIIGGLVPAYYTIGLSFTIESVSEENAAQANGYFISAYGAGTIAGPLMASTLIEAAKLYGYWIGSAAICIIFLLSFRRLTKNSS
ncbi:MAG: MFS transporter [Ignavibacteriales bacterium]|nr:MFS transporter [Ignavibacteriales bacterium]MCF8316747.1 MFS transporter [Ignavibacteriales bacterium]MCF8436019.1 MFS transporter [Ignavibacteriales bacterium]